MIASNITPNREPPPGVEASSAEITDKSEEEGSVDSWELSFSDERLVEPLSVATLLAVLMLLATKGS